MSLEPSSKLDKQDEGIHQSVFDLIPLVLQRTPVHHFYFV